MKKQERKVPTMDKTAYTVIEEKPYGIQEVFNLIGEEYLNRQNSAHKKEHNMVVDGFDVYPISLRYMNFYQHGVTCVACGRVGTHFKLCGDSRANRRHFNLYTDDGVLMTKDHIIPKSKGGMDIVSNMQTMCACCNRKKGNSHPTIKIPYIVAVNKGNGHEMLFRDINKAARHLVISNLKPSKKNMEAVVNTTISAVLNIQSALANNGSYAGFDWRTEER